MSFVSRVFRNLPLRSLSERFARSEALTQIVGSSLWLGSDKLFRLAIGLFVGVWLARYLGPDEYGVLGYALAFAALWQPLAALGLDSIVVRDIVRHPDQSGRLVGTSFVLKLFGGLLTTVAATGSVMILRPGAHELHLIVGLLAASAIAQSADVIDFWFQSQVKAKPVVVAKNSAFLVISTCKVALILTQAPLIAFAMAALAEGVLAAAFLLVAYRLSDIRAGSFSMDWRLARRLLAESWGLLLSAVAVMIHIRIDQVMLGHMAGDRAVGVFTAATRITEVLYFLPMIVMTSVAPALIRAKERDPRSYEAKFLKLFRFLAFGGLALAVPISLAAPLIISLLFGPAYSEAAMVLQVHVWALIFVCVGVTQSRWFVIEGLGHLAFYRAALGAMVNVLLNLILIPRFGAVGAAFGTLAAQFCTAIVFNATSVHTRPILKMQWQALTFYQRP
jgi:polysaccharide transporter, PST family